MIMKHSKIQSWSETLDIIRCVEISIDIAFLVNRSVHVLLIYSNFNQNIMFKQVVTLLSTTHSANGHDSVKMRVKMRNEWIQ